VTELAWEKANKQTENWQKEDKRCYSWFKSILWKIVNRKKLGKIMLKK
jgi:hypothetical protein